jgi:hypothetical protein
MARWLLLIPLNFKKYIFYKNSKKNVITQEAEIAQSGHPGFNSVVLI